MSSAALGQQWLRLRSRGAAAAMHVPFSLTVTLSTIVSLSLCSAIASKLRGAAVRSIRQHVAASTPPAELATVSRQARAVAFIDCLKEHGLGSEPHSRDVSWAAHLLFKARNSDPLNSFRLPNATQRAEFRRVALSRDAFLVTAITLALVSGDARLVRVGTKRRDPPPSDDGDDGPGPIDGDIDSKGHEMGRQSGTPVPPPLREVMSEMLGRVAPAVLAEGADDDVPSAAPAARSGSLSPSITFLVYTNWIREVRVQER